MKRLFLSLLLAGTAWPVFAQSKTLLNVDEHGIALQGYDPVAFFTDHQPVKGSPAFVARRDGAIYFFATKEHRARFIQAPAKYEPVFGGYCAYGVCRNRLVEIDVTAFQIIHDRLLLQYSQSVRDKFNLDTEGNLAKAMSNWPGLVEKKGK